MRLSIHQLNVFRQVVESMSVTEAARVLHMTQPAVSNILRQLQDYFDCSPLETIGRQIHLTDFGEIIYGLAKNIDELIESTHAEINLTKGGLTGELKVAIASTAKYFMPKFLGDFKQAYPDVHIHMKVYPRAMILKRLRQNLDHFVVLSQLPSDIAIDAKPAVLDALVIVSHPEHPLARTNRPLSLNQLQDCNWIIREMGSGTRNSIDKYFSHLNFIPKVEMELGNNEAIKQAVMADLGIAVLSQRSIANEVKFGLISQLSVVDFPMPHQWYLVNLKGKKLPPVAEHFYRVVAADN